MLAPAPEFDALVYRALEYLTLSLGLLFICFVALGFIDRSAGSAWAWIVGTDAATMIFYFASYAALRTGWLPRSLTYPAGIVFAAVPAANSLLAFALTGNEFFLTYLPMVAIGCGAYMLSLPWLWLSFALLALATWEVSTLVLSPTLAGQYAPALVGACIVSTLIMVIRRFLIIDNQRALIALKKEMAERKRAQAQLAHVQRLESIGKLVSGIAHDFNNLLMVVLGYTDGLLETQTDPELIADLEIVYGAGQSAAVLASKLLAFGRQQVMQPKVVDANTLVRDAEALVSKLLPPNVSLALALDPDAGAVKVDPIQIEQVLINLALNGRDAMPGGGALTLSTEAAGTTVEIRVRDTGAGMPASVRERAFEPFFTTKEAGRGTGLGLSMVHGIVTQSGGTIAIDTAPGHGTTMTVRLPRVAARPAEHSSGGAVAAAQRQLAGLVALAVDDEPEVRAVVRRMLEQQGCVVHEAQDARHALSLVRQHDVDLFIIDVVMPGMSGVELLDALRRGGHSQPALLVSGHAAEKVAAFGGLNAPLLQKPFAAGDLLRALARLMRRSA